MKVLLPLVVLVIFAQSLEAQWLPVPPAGFDRGKPTNKAQIRTIALASEPTKWLFPNVNISQSPITLDQTEPSIAIDPLDPSKLVVGFIDDTSERSLVVSHTTDGVNWQKQILPTTSPWVDYVGARATDPSVVFNSKGVAYYLLGRQATYDSGPNDVLLYVSSDTGATWQWIGSPFADTLHPFAEAVADKYYLTIDTSPESPYKDHLHASWVEYASGDPMPRIGFSTSTDGGITWPSRTYLTKAGFYTSPIPVTTPDGTIIVTFEQYWDTNAVWSARSTDGGKTFSAPQIIAHYKNLGTVNPNTSRGYQTIGPGLNLVMVNSFPSIAAVHAGDHKGRACIAWSGMGEDTLPHVYLSMSDDGGSTWSIARAVEADSMPHAYSRYYPWIAADAVTGNIGIEYYCVPTGPENMQADQYLAHSADGGATFRARKITSLPSLLTVQKVARSEGGYTLWFYGDYINLAGCEESWHPVWADSRKGDDIEIYTSLVQPFAPMPVTNLALHDTTLNGKIGTAVSWEYKPETTFGYPLPQPYFFVVSHGGYADTLSSSTLVASDTSFDSTRTYIVFVLAGKYRSIPDSISRRTQGVASHFEDGSVAISLSRQPAIAGRTESITVASDEACALEISFYDELGRDLGMSVQDPSLRTEHAIHFTPETSGVSYYLIRGITDRGVWQRTGRFLTLPGE